MWTDDLAHLRSLISVMDSGSIAGAARRLGTSPATVSRHISAIERELGMPLFERTGRALRPSGLARTASEHARLVIEEADHLQSALRSLAQGDAGTVRLAYFRAAATTLVPIVLAHMSRTHPHVRVVLIERALGEEVADMLNAGQADIGLVWGHTAPDRAQGLVIEPLLRDALMLLTSADRPDLHEDPMDLKRLVREPFSSHPSNQQGSPPRVDAMFLERGLPAPTVTHWLTDHAMAKSLIAAGVVVAMIPALGVSDDVPGVRRSIVVEEFRHIFLAHARGAWHPLATALSDAMRYAARSYRGLGVEFIGHAAENASAA